MTNANGGFVFVDINGLNIYSTETQQLPEGSYSRILSAIEHGKIIAFVNATDDESKYSPIVLTGWTGTNGILTMDSPFTDGERISVNPDDTITFAEE